MAQRPTFRLRIELGNGPRSELLSSDDRVLVGRSAQADLVVEDESVSLIHCEITAEEDQFVLRDLGSQTGTWIGGIKVREVALTSEARIGVGAAEISFNLESTRGELSLYPESRFGRLIGESRAMRAAFARLARVAARDITVLLEGESGTGKELAAEAIHESSARQNGPFVVLDCAAVPQTLLETELFGHERGAYTGAMHARPGAFVRAHGGTIFLDEIGELDVTLQPRLLGVLERREVKPIGSAQPVPVDVRVIAATNRDLRRWVNEGAFREDLYYRLAVGCVRLPALRERVEDIPLLVRQFLGEHSRRDAVTYRLEEAVVHRLMQRPWPGNVRELRNAVEQFLAFGHEEVAHSEEGAAEVTGERTGAEAPFKVAKAQVLEQFEREYLVSVLARHAGNITAAAAAADIDRVHFLRLLDRHGLRRSRR
jgi:transcriptional regulator with PAS, ATPase and Fis domain